MFGRPRCREWTPLSTQQLRLRSLIQIVGYNIRPPEWCMSHCSFYLTLHHTTMSAPFYTSERISSPHPKWKEIDSEITRCMSSSNVVIRIWCHALHHVEELDDRPQDTVIQTWGVYFSGLRYIGANLALNFTSDCFKCNTLVFQMHGGYFCSYKSLKLDVIPPENELDQGSLSSDSSGKISLYRNSLEPKLIHNHKHLKESRSISPSKYRRSEKEYSKSHSPVERGFKHNFLRMKPSPSLNIGHSQRELYYRHIDDSNERRKIEGNHDIYEHSPDNSDVKEFTSTDVDYNNLSRNASTEELTGSKIDLSEIAENYDLRNESDGSPKYRYIALSFLKSEIRPSYNAAKLQKLHLLQYSIKKRQEAVQEIKERIYKKSAYTNECWSPPNEQKLLPKCKSRSQRNLFSPDETEHLDKEKSSLHAGLIVKNGKVKEDRAQIASSTRLSLKLSDLLSNKAKPSPLQRAEHLRLTKQLEILRFKRIILADERDSKLANIRRLKEKHAKLFEENQDLGSALMERYHTLSKSSEDLKETHLTCGAMLELAARSHAMLANKRSTLLGQLQQIFCIEQIDENNWTICGVSLPICGDDSPRTLSPVGDAVAAGYVAQATCLAAAILNQPLRYKITLLGSASKVLDVTPDLPDPNIPLFPRGGDVTLFRYGMFLLNKCIAQLLWGRAAPVTDMRPTLANLHRLLNKPSNLSDTSKLFGAYKWLTDNQCGRTQSLRSMVASERGKFRQFNRFKDSVDGQSPQYVMNLRRHRHSKSVGSYHDDLPPFNASTTSIMGSAPNIYNTKLKQINSDHISDAMKTHCSDSEISKLSDEIKENKVVFTLGEDTLLNELKCEKLVRISTNNGDALGGHCHNDNVKRICSEIENFCSNNDGKSETCDIVKDNVEGTNSIDIVKYMEGKSNAEETCECNEENCERVCAKVKDVIVIPSAEAILDTGQNLSDTPGLSEVIGETQQTDGRGDV